MTANAISTKELARLIGNVAEEKQSLITKALSDKIERYNPILIGGNIFTFGYLGFQTLLMYMPQLTANVAVSLTGFILGEIAGVVTLLGGLIALKEALHAHHNGDKELERRLFLDFISSTGIGIVMLLVTTAAKVGYLAGVAAFFAANPWLLPVLFFVMALPILHETSKRIYNSHTKQDLQSKLQLDDLHKNIAKLDFQLPTPFHIESKVVNDLGHSYLDPKARLARREVYQILTDRMEKFQSEMGVKGAVEAFRTWKNMLEQKPFESHRSIKTLKARVSTWNKAQKVRFAQQAFLVAGVGFSLLGSFPPGGNEQLAKIMDTSNNAALAIGSGIMSTCMDSKWPFKRNNLIVIPKLK